MKDTRLEMLSDMVRRGETLPLPEVIEVIEYQTRLKKIREEQKKVRWNILWNSTPIGMIINFLKGKL